MTLRNLRSSSTLGLMLLLGSLGCERAPSSQPGPGYDYYPLVTGQWAEYEVTEITYALNQSPRSRVYRFRETTGMPYTDVQGQSVYPLQRAHKSTQGEWVADSISLAWRTAQQALRAENGTTRVKIQFPIYEQSRWNGNLFNTLPEQTYQITSLNLSVTTGLGIFDKTITVVQQNDSTLLSLRRSQEVYAENIGLIQRERTSVQYCGTPNCLGKGIIDYGFTQRTILTNYSK